MKSLLQHLSATFPLQGSWRLIKVRRKCVSEKDQVSSVSVKLLEHVLNPESHHPSYFSIHPFLLMQHLMILLISHIFLLGIIFLQKKIQLSFSVFQLSWPTPRDGPGSATRKRMSCHCLPLLRAGGTKYAARTRRGSPRSSPSAATAAESRDE